MSLDHNKAVVRRLFDELVNGYDLHVVDEIIAPDIVLHDPVFGTAGGIDMFKQLLGVFRTAFPEQHTTLDVLTAEGDLVTALHTHTGRHLGPFMGMPPTGKDIHIEGLELYRVADGKIIEFWRHDDDAGLLRQLGAIPEPATAPAD